LTAVSNAPNNAARVLIFAGTTAVGKTEVSIPLAELLKGEIVNADSRQVYRELEVGTAKPSAEQMARLPHHLVGTKSIRERWTAGDFAREARRTIGEIGERGKLPVVVGGSMLYLRALVDGFFDDDDEESYDYGALRKEWDERGTEAMYAELMVCDPALAARTHPHDHHRILRALAVRRGRGASLSDFQSRPRVPLENPFRLYFLHANREETYRRVNERVLHMVESGLVEEVRSLAEQGINETNCNALRTHGYQEVFPFLRGEISREQMIDDIQKAVRHYVKRQATWFRHEPRAVWMERSFHEPPEAVAERIRADWDAWRLAS
jgi:tRNA dimethylallyltransferase